MSFLMTREEIINNLLDEFKDALVVTCNGRTGRELFELRKKRGEPNEDFIMIGSMGLAISIALGIALNTQKQVKCLVGDGNLLMNLGSLATYLKLKPKNLEIIVLNNDSHDSTGGQPTYFSAIREHIPLRIIDIDDKTTRINLGRPTDSPEEIKNKFMAKCSG